jgi:hypothetical protein
MGVDAVMIASASLTPQDVREAAAMVCETVGQRWHGTQLEDACDECAGAIRAMELPPTGWQPIETAPQDGTRILLWRAGHVICGRFDPDRRAAKPRPYWTHDAEFLLGKLDARATAPTHWQPLPAPPETKS